MAHRLQEWALGGLTLATRRLLNAAGEHVEETPVRPAPPQPGIILLREWHGVNHQVTVLEGNLEYRERRYRSLSQVARVITDSRWSGPLFFGLRRERPIEHFHRQAASPASPTITAAASVDYQLGTGLSTALRELHPQSTAHFPHTPIEFPVSPGKFPVPAKLSLVPLSRELLGEVFVIPECSSRIKQRNFLLLPSVLL